MPESAANIANSDDTVKDSSTNGWVRFPRDVLFDENLSHGARLTYAALIAFCFDGVKASVSLTRLADSLRFAGKTGERRLKSRSGVTISKAIGATYSRQSLARWVDELAACGYVEIVSGRKGTKNSYLLPRIKAGTSIKGDTGFAPTGSSGTGINTDGTLYQGSYRTGIKVGTLTKLRSRDISRNVRGATEKKSIEACDEFLELHQKATGWSFQLVATDLAKAIATVGSRNEAALLAHYKWALTQPSIEKPLGYAIKQLKLAESAGAA